ncbi:MAG: hypothetical protein WC606_03285 [Candidatus Absconditabacterales bacterium]|jgi:hypothetical protein
MKKNIIVFIVHNYRFIEDEINALTKGFHVEHFFNPKEAKDFLEVYKDEIFCVILDTAFIYSNTQKRYDAYLQLKETILKGINVLVTELLCYSHEINEGSKLKEKDVFRGWIDIFGQYPHTETKKLLKKIFPDTQEE